MSHTVGDVLMLPLSEVNSVKKEDIVEWALNTWYEKCPDEVREFEEYMTEENQLHSGDPMSGSGEFMRMGSIPRSVYNLISQVDSYFWNEQANNRLFFEKFAKARVWYNKRKVVA